MTHVLTSKSSNAEIAEIFQTIGEILTAQGENIFRTRAYARAAESIRNLEQPLVDIWQKDQTNDIPGIGKGFIGLINELFTVGFIKEFDLIIGAIPAGAFKLMKLPGVGVKKALRLAQEFTLTDAETAFEIVKKEIEAGRLQEMEGFGQKSADQILAAIDAYVDRPSRFVLPLAGKVAESVMAHLLLIPESLEVQTLGSSRRKSPTVGDIDVAVKTTDTKKIMDHVQTFPGIQRILAAGKSVTRFIDVSGIQVDVKTHSPAGWGSMLQHYTGSKQHNIALRSIAQKKGWSLSEDGMKKNGETLLYDSEAELYSDLGMTFIPPELREDRGEVAAALKNQLPNLIELTDIKGDLHIHTKLEFPTSHDMGVSTIFELLAKASELKYAYTGFSDHNPRTSGLSAQERLAAVQLRNQMIDDQVNEWKKHNKKSKLQVMKGLEVDIKPDGTLALEDEALDLLDYAIASIHSQLKQPREEMTARILKGLAHPKVRVWGHPSGRVLMERDGVDCDWERIFAFCAEYNKIIEINSAPSRLDLADTLIPVALKHGVKFIINTDTHHAVNMDLMSYGVSQARRGWLEAEDVVNTYSTNSFSKLLSS